MSNTQSHQKLCHGNCTERGNGTQSIKLPRIKTNPPHPLHSSTPKLPRSIIGRQSKIASYKKLKICRIEAVTKIDQKN